MRFKSGFDTAFFSMCGAVLGVYGIVVDLNVVAYIGIAIMILERSLVAFIFFQASRLHKKMAGQTLDTLKHMVETLMESEGVDMKKPYDQEKEG